MEKPKVICLCGSTRFIDVIAVEAWQLEKKGNITLHPNILPGWYAKGHHLAEAEGVKELLDELHCRKIDLADEIFVVNYEGYYGESTSNEIAYAMKTGKPVKWFAPEYAFNPTALQA